MTGTAHDESGLAAATVFYEQGGSRPAPVDPPTMVYVQVKVSGVVTAKMLANDLAAQLVEHPAVEAVDITVTEAGEGA